MTVAEMIEALKRFDDSDLLVIETADGDYMPLSDELVRVKIGVNSEHYRCAAVGHETWPSESGGYDYALEDEL
jgi:hypothetical protein